MSSEETSNLTEEQKNDDDSVEEASKEELPEEEAPKEEAPKEEAPKEEAPKEEAPKEEAPKEEAPKEEAPKEESNQEQSSTNSSETPNQSNDQNSENSSDETAEDTEEEPKIPLEKKYATRSEDTSKYEMKIGLSPLFGKKKSRLPLVKVSPMNYLTQGFNFIVTLNEFMFGFKSVSGLSIDRGYDFITEGGVNDHPVKVGRPTSNDGHKLTFERGLMIRVSTVIERAAKAAASLIPFNLPRKAALMGLSALNPQESLETGPALGTIQVYNRSNELTAAYEFLSLGMSEWSVDDLNADNGEILIEHITIVHTGLTRFPLGLGTIAKRATVLDSEYQAAETPERMEELRKKLKEKLAAEKKRIDERKAAADKFWGEYEKKQKELKEERKKQREILEKAREYAKQDIEKDLEENRKEQEEFKNIQNQAKKDFEEKLKKKLEENRKEQERLLLEREKTSKKMRKEYEDKMKKLKESGASQKEIENAKKDYKEKIEKENEKQKEINAKQEAEVKELQKEHNDKMPRPGSGCLFKKGRKKRERRERKRKKKERRRWKNL